MNHYAASSSAPTSWRFVGFGGLVIASLRGAPPHQARAQRARAGAAMRGATAMTPKRKRLWLLVGSLCVLGAATALVLSALSDNLVFFYSPTQMAREASRRPSGACASAAWSSRAA